MKFKEFLKLIKQFDCKALEDKEVEHCFIDRNLNTFSEKVTDIVYDAERNRFRIICDSPLEIYCSDKNLIKGKTAQ